MAAHDLLRHHDEPTREVVPLHATHRPTQCAAGAPPASASILPVAVPLLPTTTCTAAEASSGSEGAPVVGRTPGRLRAVDALVFFDHPRETVPLNNPRSSRPAGASAVLRRSNESFQGRTNLRHVSGWGKILREPRSENVRVRAHVRDDGRDTTRHRLEQAQRDALHKRRQGESSVDVTQEPRSERTPAVTADVFSPSGSDGAAARCIPRVPEP